MKRRVFLGLALLATSLQTGCINVNFRDAVAAGIFDFISGTITDGLSSLISGGGA